MFARQARALISFATLLLGTANFAVGFAPLAPNSLASLPEGAVGRGAARCEQRWISSGTRKCGAGLRMVKRDDTEEEASLPLKVTWYAAEMLGNFARALRGSQDSQIFPNEDDTPMGLTADEMLKRLQGEYEKEYFISGDMDLSLYTDDCVFADPFASFRGKARFVNNLKNLPQFILDSETRLLSLQVDESGQSIISRVMVKLQLNLPWRPVLAWPWGVKHVMDPRTGRISEHRESWEVSPGEGIRQVFRPGPRDGLRQGRGSRPK